MNLRVNLSKANLPVGLPRSLAARLLTKMAISYTATGSLTSSFSQIKAGFAAAKLNPGQCFVAGTLVLTEDGLIPIEEVEEGMLVWASDPETGETALKPV